MGLRLPVLHCNWITDNRDCIIDAGHNWIDWGNDSSLAATPAYSRDAPLARPHRYNVFSARAGAGTAGRVTGGVAAPQPGRVIRTEWQPAVRTQSNPHNTNIRTAPPASSYQFPGIAASTGSLSTD